MLACALACAAPVWVRAQALPQTPAPTPPTPAERWDAEAAARRMLPAQPGETVLVPSLRGIVLVNDAQEAQAHPGGGDGFDFSRVPVRGLDAVQELAGYFLGKPASLGSLERLAAGIQQYLQASGRRFVLVYLPPQELVGDSVRIVVQRARLDGAVSVEGVNHFSAGQYQALLGTAAGEPIDEGDLDATLDRLNRNPFRRSTVVAEPGSQPGTTRLALRLLEQRPLQFFVGADNTGTPATARNRWTAGVNWGDAFGRGDQLSYQFKADPRMDRIRSHSGSYATEVGVGTLSLNGAWSAVTPDLGPLFGQEGHSWQVSGRYSRPASAPAGWAAQWSLGADLKASDNTIEFSTVPVVNNETRIVQAAASYALRRRGPDSSSELSTTLVASPGGLGSRNADTAFGGSRLGAKARYAYLRLDGGHRQALRSGWSARVNASVQAASGPLLGSEQLAGTGAGAARGFRENAAFGDSGFVATG